MRIVLSQHHLSIEPSDEWIADEMKPETVDTFGVYLQSKEHGVYLNVRGQTAGDHPLNAEGLVALLREQGWASPPSPPFDEWTVTAGSLTVVGGTFETTGMGGEVVLEVFASDGRSVANLAGPGERAAIAAVIPAVQRLVSTLRFEDVR